MMITRRKAMPQVIGFLSMENGLFFAATSATYGMPMVVELGIALDVLVGMLILGVFFFQIREQFDSLDIRTSREAEGGLTVERRCSSCSAFPLAGGAACSRCVGASRAARRELNVGVQPRARFLAALRAHRARRSRDGPAARAATSSSSSIRSTSSWSR